jgi:hypothetical protein
MNTNDTNCYELEKIMGNLTRAYLECVAFTDYEELNGSDFSIEAKLEAFATMASFISKNYQLFIEWCESGRTADSFAYDVWFTRNGHGVGFWDRGAGELGEKLTKAAKLLGAKCVYVDDDGFIYFD